MNPDRFLRVIVLAGLVLVAAVGLQRARGAAAPEFDAIRADAEKLVAEGSYALAHDVYAKAKGLPLGPDERRWLDFRLADTLWRGQAGSQTADSTKFDQARQQLEALVRDAQRAEQRDRVWAEVQESLGDFWWTRRDTRNWHPAWQFYQAALDWWGGSKDTSLARERYLRIVGVAAEPPGVEPYYYYGYHGNWMPPAVLRNALKIAQTDSEKARMRYLLAMSLQQNGDNEERRLVLDEFEEVLKLGKKSDWYDDALYNSAVWLANNGRMIREKNGGWRNEQDFVAALARLRLLLKEFQKGETRYHDQAVAMIAEITRPQVGVSVGNVFLPGSEAQYHLSWRNVKKVKLALHKVELTKAVRFAGRGESPHNWLQAVDPAAGVKVAEWTHETGDKGDYRYGNATLRLDRKPGAGAYLLTAEAESAKAREMVLVSDATLVTKAGGSRLVAYLCDVNAGAPLAEATVRLFARYHDGSEYRWKEMTAEANAEGLAVFDLPGNRYAETFVCAGIGDRQAYCLTSSDWREGPAQQWRIYAFTDRPAYRPKEKVQWKFIARVLDNDAYSTPGGQTVAYEVRDPRGAKLKEGSVRLNACGAGWGDCDLGAELPLGEYRISFYTENRGRHIGDAVLFRMEEYKLPEFKVSVTTPEEKGRRKTFLPGEKVEAVVQADYYFGGPVANATVEVLVYQNPFYHYWAEPREFAWYYDDAASRYGGWGEGGQIVKRETLKTDAAGKVRVTFESPRQPGQDWEYRIEARVTDASRREIVGSGTVRVSQQRYYAHLTPAHAVHRPRDTVKVAVRTMDANDQPFPAEGAVTVTRQRWVEVWRSPEGKEFRDAALARVRASTPAFPPQPKTGAKPWQRTFCGYEQEAVLKQTVKTDAQGQAEFAFAPDREGYFMIAWNDPEDDGRPVNAAANVWVATDATSDIGYRHGGIQIVVDKDTVLPGRKTPVMLTVPTNDRYVLFTVEAENLMDYRLVHVKGNVKLIELPIEDRHVPNVYLSAAMVSDRQVFMDGKELVVPPAKHFISLSVKSDRAQYEPRTEGTLEVTALDHEGKPVAAEVSLGLVDESVFYIQKDYAGDPRQFYFGQKRGMRVQTQSSFNYRGYVRLVADDRNNLVDERYARRAGEVPGNVAVMKPTVAACEEPKSGAFDSLDVGGVMEEGSRSDSIRAAPSPRGSVFKMKGISRQRDSAGRREAKEEGGEGVAGEEPAVLVRTDFRATAFWQPDLVTDANGKATVKVKFPDSLTGWRATARAVGTGAQFGIASADMRTRMPLIVRLQAPRFFVAGDTLTVSAVINNNTDKPVSVRPTLKADGLAVTGVVRDGQPAKGEHGSLTIPANGDARADWIVHVEKAGPVRLRAAAQGDGLADAMESTFVAHEHGIEKFVSKAGKVRGQDAAILIDIPAARKPESTVLSVQVTPSLAVTMLDALPYLADYPYGCTEQTMSRFLPAVVTAKTLRDLGLKPEAVADKIFGGIERENADKTHTKSRSDLSRVDDMVKAGLDRLYGFQHGDGGWGWWKDGESDHFMTAYVVWGLCLARDAKAGIRDDALGRAVDFLQKELVEEEANPDMQAWMLHALAVARAARGGAEMHRFEAKALENLWGNKDKLNAYTRAMLALAAHRYGQADKAATLVRNLLNGVKKDDAPDVSVVQRGAQESAAGVMGSAHWGEDGLYWRWSDGGVEATAFALRALLAVDPKNELVEPVMNWLVKNRRGAQWSNTRDTAIVVLAMNEYLRASGELQPDMEVEVSLNGKPLGGGKVNAETVFSAPSRYTVDRALICDGTNEIRVTRKGGQGAMYFAVQASFFSLEEPIPPAGNQVFVRRQYYRHVARPTLLKGTVYDREPLNDGGTVASGDRIETVVTIEAKNNLEYLVFEDLKPAGFEAVQVRSGEPLYAKELKSGATARRFAGGKSESALTAGEVADGADYTDRSRWVYQELRDRKVALFLDKLPEGVWEIRYDMRAETPGRFHALPVLGHAMYVPEIRCNGEETRLTVLDRPAAP
jgi:uncharacterized protein YfaS (alpha-2-macroglobulin family)